MIIKYFVENVLFYMDKTYRRELKMTTAIK